MSEQKRQGYLSQKLADKPASTVDAKVYISSLKLLSERDAEIARLRAALAEAERERDEARARARRWANAHYGYSAEFDEESSLPQPGAER